MRAKWRALPREEAFLFNPAFLAVLLARACEGYEAEKESPMPITLGFVSLSLALHRPTRLRFPRAVSTNLLRWTLDNPDLLATAPTRANALVPLLRNGLLFALANGVCSLASHASISVAPDADLPSARGITNEVVECQRSAQFVGRWFGRAGSQETVLAVLGIRP